MLGLAKVCPIELVMWVACSAATMATVLGSAASSGLAARSHSTGRMKPAYSSAQARQPCTYTPRRPVEPPEAMAWISSNR
jgi:hypothetical protein